MTKGSSQMANGLTGRAQTVPQPGTPGTDRPTEASRIGFPSLRSGTAYSDVPRYVNYFACARVPFQRLDGPVAGWRQAPDPTRCPPQSGAGCLTNDSLLPTNFQSNGQPQPAQYFLRIASQEAPKGSVICLRAEQSSKPFQSSEA